MKNYLIALGLLCSLMANAQTKKVLFIGNSYTGVNNLPLLVQDVALSAGDTLIFQKHTPGGARLMDHANNPNAMAKINADTWDYVVLQAQSQEPSWPIQQVEAEVFPYAKILCDSIRANEACTRPVFYMTWGRKNGDQANCPSWPPVCTYTGMDSLLHLRYRTMGEDNEAYVSPVGAVWHYLRDSFPSIELYTLDESHPSQAGSYAAACTFYAILFQKDPALIEDDYTLSASVANSIRHAAKVIAYDNLHEWNVGSYDPKADFTYDQDGAAIDFSNNSIFSDTYFWDFGDGMFSSDSSPAHTYGTGGNYTVILAASNCGVSDTLQTEIIVQATSNRETSIENDEVAVFPNPTHGKLTVWGVASHSGFQLTDASGKKLMEGFFSPDNQIDLSNLSLGVYFLEIQSDQGMQFVKKVIKK